MGNVLVTVNDKKLGASSNNSTVDYFKPQVVSAQDYYPFGMFQPGRVFNASGYRYGFNGKENDNEVKGEGNQQDYGMRVYDPRLGRFLSVDPLTKEYPELTPYQFASNTPVQAIDLDGEEAKIVTIYHSARDREEFHRTVQIDKSILNEWQNKVITIHKYPFKTPTGVKFERVSILLYDGNTASKIIKSGRVKFATTHVSPEPGYSKDDDANAIDNINDAAKNKNAKTSPYSDVGSSEVNLKDGMLNGMKKLSEKYTFDISEISGGDHSTTSKHYKGRAFDVTKINGEAVNSDNPYFTDFMKMARELGATLTLGPGDKDHANHVHVEWNTGK